MTHAASFLPTFIYPTLKYEWRFLPKQKLATNRKNIENHRAIYNIYRDFYIEIPLVALRITLL
jgi:hypothetical protein